MTRTGSAGPGPDKGTTDTLVLRNLLSSMNDVNPGEITSLSDDELNRLESLCEIWARRAFNERARRSAEPSRPR